MARGKVKTNNLETAEVPISAMIDVVFLLIIFFVVTAAVDKEIEDELIVLAQSPHGAPLTTKDPRTVTINVRQDGSIKIGLTEIPANQPALQKQEIMRVLRTAMRDPRYGKDFPIIIRGDVDAQHYYISRVMDAVKETMLYTIQFNAQKISK